MSSSTDSTPALDTASRLNSSVSGAESCSGLMIAKTFSAPSAFTHTAQDDAAVDPAGHADDDTSATQRVSNRGLQGRRDALELELGVGLEQVGEQVRGAAAHAGSRRSR